MKKLFLLSLLFFVPLIFAPNASAEIIKNFDVSVTAQKDGKMAIDEKIVYDFEYANKHGIFRNIPLYAKVGPLYRVLKIKDVKVLRDGKKEKFSTTSTKEQISFKIGDPDKTIDGAHTYEISYVVENGIGSNYKDHDEIFWNATGNEWTVAIQAASINTDTDFGVKPERMKCFTGAQGSKDQNCEVSQTLVKTTKPLFPSEGLTTVAAFPVDTFPDSFLYSQLPKSTGEKVLGFILKHIVWIWLIINIVIPLFLFLWYQNRKNKKRFGPPTVNFDLPKTMSGERITPAEAGTIDSATLQKDDVVATLFDLAIRKYIKLEEVKVQKALRADTKDQIVTKLKEDDGSLTSFEKTLFKSLFATGDRVKFKDLRTSFYTTYQEMEKEVFNSLVSKGLYSKNPKTQRAFLVVFGMWALFTLNIGLAFAFFMLARKLIGRTQLGDELDYKIDGLKLFLKSTKRNYNWQTKNFYTVEQMIPYAVALGFIEEFMQQLKLIKPDYSPTWYHGYTNTSFYNMYSGFYSSTSSNITTSAPSSSSGFSSGGSSGGGGGGGGGGSW